jgi:N-acetylmuramoyl-L-alanine amidase
MAKSLVFFMVSFIFIAAAYAENGTIVIDAGHGGFDSGLVSAQLKEKDLSLTIALELQGEFKKSKKVFLTREIDRHLSLKDRITFVQGRSPLMLLSLHVSDSDSFAVYVSWYPEEALPMSEYYASYARQRDYLDASRLLAKNIEEALKAAFGISVLHREMPLPILNSTPAPSVLIETPNFKYADFGSKELRDKFVSSIINGVAAYASHR